MSPDLLEGQLAFIEHRAPRFTGCFCSRCSDNSVRTRKCDPVTTTGRRLARGAALNGDRVAVVTGGARGIGWSIAAALSERGYQTVILDNGTSLDGSGD